MSRIDLKYATIRIMDGYGATGASVDNVSNYAANAVSMIIQGAPGSAIPLGAAFRVVGSNKLHIVTSVSGGPPTTTIGFTPGLSGVVLDNAVIVFYGRTVEVKIGDGNLTYNEAREMTYELEKGLLDSVKEGDQQPMEINMDFVWDFITAVGGADYPTIEDALKQRGPASGWLSSATDDPCAPYAVDIVVEYLPPGCEGVEPEVIILRQFRWEGLDHNFTDAQVSCTGKCNVVEAEVERIAS